MNSIFLERGEQSEFELLNYINPCLSLFLFVSLAGATKKFIFVLIIIIFFILFDNKEVTLNLRLNIKKIENVDSYFLTFFSLLTLSFFLLCFVIIHFHANSFNKQEKKNIA